MAWRTQGTAQDLPCAGNGMTNPTLANDIEDSLESGQRETPGDGSEPTFKFIRNEHERLHT